MTFDEDFLLGAMVGSLMAGLNFTSPARAILYTIVLAGVYLLFQYIIGKLTKNT